MATIAYIPTGKELLVEYNRTIGVGYNLLDKNKLYPYINSNPLSGDRTLLPPLAFPCSSLTLPFYWKQDYFYNPAFVDDSLSVVRGVVYSEIDGVLYWAALGGDKRIVFYKGTDLDLKSNGALPLDSSVKNVFLADFLASNSEFLVFQVLDSGFIITKINITNKEYTTVYSSGEDVFITKENPIKFLGNISSKFYFSGVVLGNSGEAIWKIFEIDATDASVSEAHTVNLGTDYSTIYIPPTPTSIKREDGAIYALLFFNDASNQLQAKAVLIEDGGINDLDISLDYGSFNSDEVAFSSIGATRLLQAVGNIGGEKAVLLISLYRPDVAVDSVLLNYDFLTKAHYWKLDEANAKLVLTDYNSFHSRPINSVLPIDESLTTFYLHYLSGLGKLKIASDKILVAPVVSEHTYDFIGFSDNGYLWGVGPNYVELLPLYSVSKYLELEWASSSYNYDGSPIDTTLTVRLFDEEGNRVAGKVQLTILSANAIFTDTSSYTVTVNVAADTDATVNVQITNSGLVVIEPSILE